MTYVYLLKSLKYPHEIYIGYTKYLKDRLAQHNQGASFHTSKFAPWELEVFFVFKNENAAIKFEKYLKSCSGRAFISKRLQV